MAAKPAAGAPAARPAAAGPAKPRPVIRYDVAPRRLVRWEGMLDWAIRPGRGILYAGLLLGLTLVYGTSRGGHWGEVGSALFTVPDAIASAAGFGIRQITVDGRRALTDHEILDALQFGHGRSLVFLDLGAARHRLMDNPLVKDATLRKLYPDRLVIHVTERDAYALWQHDGKFFVIAQDGTTIMPADGRFPHLPLVVGVGADAHAHEILSALDAVPALKDRVYAAVRVGDRRWNLRLDNGVDVKLPNQDFDQALKQLAGLDASDKLLERDITEVDLRRADRMTVRLSDAAAKAEADAMAKTKKKKGGKA
ncbi:MAG TPA: cell division protein FtsQ/DivIB [Hyphomicrobiales bacterium]|nr:cell division protein FtsQ/DivIB [Hyphomicrobiales bacterium]